MAYNHTSTYLRKLLNSNPSPKSRQCHALSGHDVKFRLTCAAVSKRSASKDDGVVLVAGSGREIHEKEGLPLLQARGLSGQD